MANNEHIYKALDDYIEKKDVEGAFYINGLWGSGKTYFIKEFIKRKNQILFKIQYISLNGIRNNSEINEELFCLCNPTISKIKNNKLIKGAGTIFEWILKQKGINLSEFKANHQISGKPI